MVRNKIILLLVLGILTSCFDDGDCTTTKTDLLQVSFRKFETNEIDTVEIKGITLTGTDSVFHQKDTTTLVTLPLDPNVTTLEINFSFEVSDQQLTLDYGTTPRLISPECGAELSFVNLALSLHDFDSVAVVATSLDEQITSNIVIYQ